jgi:hypothetical protein
MVAQIDTLRAYILTASVHSALTDCTYLLVITYTLDDHSHVLCVHAWTPSVLQYDK